jgi:GT2 family glycosyltransferase
MDVTQRRLPAEPQPVLDDFTVIIPTLGRDLLEDGLLSIAMGNALPHSLIVVDQSSSPKVANWVARLSDYGIQALYCPSTKRGAAAGRNTGISQARTRFVAFIDDDCRADPNWLVNLSDHLHHHPTHIVTGLVEPGGDGPVASINTSPTPRVYTRPQLKEDVLFTGNMGCARDIFTTIGLFDESEFLRYAEDNDWSYRALCSGIAIAYAPNIVVTHLDWRDASQLAATYRGYASSQGGYYGKHLGHGSWYMVLRICIELARGLRRWLVGIIRKDSDRRASGHAFVTHLLPGILAGLRGAHDRN